MRLAIILLATLWLIPYLAVRTSGESLSSDFLAFGVALLLLTSTSQDRSGICKNSEAVRQGVRIFTNSATNTSRSFPLSAALLAGVLFGLAFEFRFQIAFAVIGVVGWVICTSADSARRRGGLFTLISCGVAAAVILGTLVADHWGYGRMDDRAVELFSQRHRRRPGRISTTAPTPFGPILRSRIASPLAPDPRGCGLPSDAPLRGSAIRGISLLGPRCRSLSFTAWFRLQGTALHLPDRSVGDVLVRARSVSRRGLLRPACEAPPPFARRHSRLAEAAPWHSNARGDCSMPASLPVSRA